MGERKGGKRGKESENGRKEKWGRKGDQIRRGIKEKSGRGERKGEIGELEKRETPPSASSK